MQVVVVSKQMGGFITVKMEWNSEAVKQLLTQIPDYCNYVNHSGTGNSPETDSDVGTFTA